MFNPAKAADDIKKEYIGYISTTYHFRDQRFQRKFEKELWNTVSKGPFVEIKDSFRSGKSIEELIQEGVLSPLFSDLEKVKKENGKTYPIKLPVERPLYLHQENAIRKIVKGKNVVVSTGTGSGKTHCFLIPVINELLREKEQGTLNAGVRAIFIYPMNALANDQIKGLREILMEFPDIRFGVYNGGTEEEENAAIRLYKAMYSNEKYDKLKTPLPNEALSRKEMKKNPPHILFTNYAMLEHMLLRPGDDPIFSNSNFKFVVLDEAHVYTGATGIETSFLMGRLKGRMAGVKPPQFILTSATLGDGSERSNRHVVEFAQQLTGCSFDVTDIVTADRENPIKSSTIKDYPIQLFAELSDEKLFFEDVLKKYNLQYDYASEKEPDILFDLISSSKYYAKMRQNGTLVLLNKFSETLGISQEEAVSFIALCARARKNGKALIDIRYHFFLRALDGCHIALEYPESLSLVRKNEYETSNQTEKMFEIAVCDDCGEIAIVGKIENGKLVRASDMEERHFFQVKYDEDLYEEDEDEDLTQNQHYTLCEHCGAIVPENQEHNQWCTCGNTKPIQLEQVNKDKCLNCRGTLRRFNLGYDAATGVIATSLYEHIPETKYEVDKTTISQPVHSGFFSKVIKPKKTEVRTGSQFLVFSDSRQGAAKFACSMNDMYKQFLRRRGVWNVLEELSKDPSNDGSIGLGDFVKKLENYFSNNKMFRKNANDLESSPTENNRNAWIAILDELYKCNRDTSLVSLGKLSFEYMGNSDEFVSALADYFSVSDDDARNYLNFLAFEVVRTGAVITDGSDLNDEDREYLFFTPNQKVITKRKNKEIRNSVAFVPSSKSNKDGTYLYYRSKKLSLTKRLLSIDDAKAVDLIDEYWKVVLDDESNPYALVNNNGQGYCIKASSFRILFGSKARLWKCKKCGKVTQFNMKGDCCQVNCDGKLERLDSEEYCRDNYYAMLYRNSKTTPLFIKEHTAQLAKTDALDYQQQFIRKEINALSCSTTFEMGVDVGDLETVFLRNIPPLPSNYAQRVGRAGRSIDAAAFAVTYARLSSHDFTYFDQPEEMINGIISPPNFNINNEKILKRHVYAIALGLFLKENPEMYSGNKADKFINEKGYEKFIEWLKSEPEELTKLLKNSLGNIAPLLKEKYLNSNVWLNDLWGDNGQLHKIINEYEQNVSYFQKEIKDAKKDDDLAIASWLQKRLERYQKNDLIDFLVRGNILPKYGFPVDSVELTQNIASDDFRSLNLTRDLSVAIAEYAPSSEVVADGRLYTSRYIRKPIVHKSEQIFETAWVGRCSCGQINYSKVPVGREGRDCVICGQHLRKTNFDESIEPRAGFVAENNVKPVPLSSQERKFKTEAIYIGDKEADHLKPPYLYSFKGVDVEVESTTNDSLVVISTDHFYVCLKCGYAIAGDETEKLKKYRDYTGFGCFKIEDNNGELHKKPFGKGECDNIRLQKYDLHHEFKTDVAKISFSCDTSDYDTMLSVMYALLNAFTNELNIERRDVKACLVGTPRSKGKGYQIIIYDDVPGGAGHSRRLVTANGEVFKAVVNRAIHSLQTCNCTPSCYRCLRSYDNQKVHEQLDRRKALAFLLNLVNGRED